MRRKALLFIVILICGCFFFSLVHGAANDPDIEIKLINPEQLTIEPGHVITLSLLVVNYFDQDIEFKEELNLPPDWQLLIPTSWFKCNAGEQQVRLISVFVPNSCPPSSYPLQYSLVPVTPLIPQKTYQLTLTAKVSPVTAIRSMSEDMPSIVIAGDEYSAKLRYLNTGNSLITLTFKVQAVPDDPVAVTPPEMSLPPGESQVLALNVKTNGELGTEVTQVLTVKAIDKNSGLIISNDTLSVDIIPRSAGKYDLFHRIPSALKLTGGWNGSDPTFQFGFSGAGSIDAAGKNKIDWLLLSDNWFDLTQNEQHLQFHYSSLSLDLNIGDKSYILSPLTMRWDDYNNLNLKWLHQDSELGFVYAEPDPSLENAAWGVYYKYQLAPGFDVKANLLNPSGPLEHRLYSVQTEIQPFRGSYLNLEYGFDSGDEATGNSTSATAYRIDFHGQSGDSSYSLETIQAAPDYFGNYNDIASTNGSLSWVLNEKYKLLFNYHSYQNNLYFDTSKNSAHSELSGNTTLYYSHNPGTFFYVSLRDYQKKELILPPAYDDEAQSIKIGLQKQFINWKVMIGLESGNYLDRIISANDSDFKIYSFNAIYTPNTGQTYLLYATVGDHNFSLTPDSNNMLGLAGSVNLWQNVTLNGEYQKSNFTLYDTGFARDYFSFALTFTANRLSFTVKGSQINDPESAKFEGSLLATYSFPWNIPTEKRTDLCVIKGKVYDAEKPGNPPIEKVILRANGITASTNKQGEFVFAPLSPGTYSIIIDKAFIGLDKIPVERFPLVIEIKKGEILNINIGLVSAAKVTGKTILLAADGENRLGAPYNISNDNLYTIQSGAAPSENQLTAAHFKEAGVLANTLIEFTDGKETFRQITDANGLFTFDGMRPGKWLLKVYDNSLPPHYYFEKTEIEVELKPGEAKEFIFQALPQIRTIQIVEEGEIKTPDPGNKEENTPIASTDNQPRPDSTTIVQKIPEEQPPKTPDGSLANAGVLEKNYLFENLLSTDVIYIVNEGDTLMTIAGDFEVALQRIIEKNFLGGLGQIKVNSVLVIPVPIEYFYTVKPNETWEDIANRHRIAVKTLKKINRLDDSESLTAGRIIIVPMANQNGKKNNANET